MAPIKLEDNMKERLEERTIEPTMAAWDRISSKLDAEQGVRKSKRVLWMAIAASFVGGALVALFLFQNMNTDTAPVLVDTNENPVFINPTETKKIQPLDANKNETLQEVEKAIVLEEKAIENEKSAVKTTVSSQNTSSESLEKNKAVAQVTSPNKTNLESSLEKKTTIDEVIVVAKTDIKKYESPTVIKGDKALQDMINEKVAEVVAQVESKESVTDAEIEELLKNAQREISNKQIFNQKTNTVDANALLLDVEAEVAPKSFRNKVFEAVVEGFEKTKNAVVNRNN